MVDTGVARRLAAVGGRVVPLAFGLLLDLVERDRRAAVTRRLARIAEDLGGAFHKAAQLLATRSDLLSEPQRVVLGRLCDRATPDPYPRIRHVVESTLSARQLGLLAAVDPVPAACGSVAQIHHARLSRDGRRIVLKVRRPGVAERFRADLRIIRALVQIANRIPAMATYPLATAVDQLETAIMGQLDFAAEARTQRFFCEAFAGSPDIAVPAIIDELCGEEVIAMDLVECGLRIDSPSLTEGAQARAVRTALRALYAMIFRHGLVHCDFHPGNLLVTPEGRLVLLDFGYTAVLVERDRRAFAELMLAVSFNDPHSAARIVADSGTPLVGPVNMGELADDLGRILEEMSGASADRFHIVRFVLELFAVQRRHAILGDPGFTMAIMSLLAVEGLLRTALPDLDFQREAVGYLAEALGEC
ncbi:ABC1 kinase family protein [Lentzea sp. NPDC051213]|uniref:ABC1 kinase family protein n=1 Tax=Lentzea sp. NPDC051213 TaxID=3364126 RepID=UPI0037B50656